MNTRRGLNRRHETAVIEAAVRAYNAQVDGTFVIESMPEPPDAILFDGSKRVWLEHTDAFYSSDWAKHLTSNAASDKKCCPMPKGPHMDMDNILAEAFLEVVLKKLAKKSYTPFIKQFGPGILVVGVESPWFDVETIQSINAKWAEYGSPNISHVFECLYLGFRNADNQNVAISWNSGESAVNLL